MYINEKKIDNKAEKSPVRTKITKKTKNKVYFFANLFVINLNFPCAVKNHLSDTGFEDFI